MPSRSTRTAPFRWAPRSVSSRPSVTYTAPSIAGTIGFAIAYDLVAYSQHSMRGGGEGNGDTTT